MIIEFGVSENVSIYAVICSLSKFFPVKFRLKTEKNSSQITLNY